MGINLSVTFSHPAAMATRVSYARIDNLATGASPVFTTVPNLVGGSGTFTVATNIPDGQYQINGLPIYADGRTCTPTVVYTSACPGLISISAINQGGVIVVNYLAPSGAPSVLININFPNGGSFSQIYVNNGNPISVGIPAGVYGTYTVNGQSVCDATSGFYSPPSANVSVLVNQPDTFNQVSNTSTGPGGTRTQIFQTGSVVTTGAVYSLTVYSVTVSVTAVSGDTPASICTKMAAAINGTSAVSWNGAGSAPAGGTDGFPPVATSSGNQVTVVLNYQNQFASSVS